MSNEHTWSVYALTDSKTESRPSHVERQSKLTADGRGWTQIRSGVAYRRPPDPQFVLRFLSKVAAYQPQTICVHPRPSAVKTFFPATRLVMMRARFLLYQL